MYERGRLCVLSTHLGGGPCDPKLGSLSQSRTWGPYSKVVTVLNVFRTILQGARTYSIWLSLVWGVFLPFPRSQDHGLLKRMRTFQSLLASARKTKDFPSISDLKSPCNHLTCGSRVHGCAFCSLPRRSPLSCLAGEGGYERWISLKLSGV